MTLDHQASWHSLHWTFRPHDIGPSRYHVGSIIILNACIIIHYKEIILICWMPLILQTLLGSLKSRGQYCGGKNLKMWKISIMYNSCTKLCTYIISFIIVAQLSKTVHKQQKKYLLRKSGICEQPQNAYSCNNCI